MHRCEAQTAILVTLKPHCSFQGLRRWFESGDGAACSLPYTLITKIQDHKSKAGCKGGAEAPSYAASLNFMGTMFSPGRHCYDKNAMQQSNRLQAVSLLIIKMQEVADKLWEAWHGHRLSRSWQRR